MTDRTICDGEKHMRQLSGRLSPAARVERAECARQVRAMAAYLIRRADEVNDDCASLARNWRMCGAQLSLAADELEEPLRGSAR